MPRFFSCSGLVLRCAALCITLLMTGCSIGSAPNSQAEATISALNAENAQLATEVATLSLSAFTPVPSSAPLPATTPTPIALSVPSTVSASLAVTSGEPVQATQGLTQPMAAALTTDDQNATLPALVAEVELTNADARIVDLRLDRMANRLYITDSAGQLHILDATNYAALATLPVSGEITLDPEHGRLFVAPATLYYQAQPSIAVVDTTALTITAQISGATHLSLDRQHNRLFVGQVLSSPTGQDEPPVRMIDGATFTLIRTLPQAGVPVYNPRRNDLIIVAHTAYLADPETGTILQDLYPAISAQECLECVGGQRVEDALVFADENLLALDIQTIGSGGGPGTIWPPHFYNATTLEPITKPASQPVIQNQCGSESTLQPQVDGRIYRHEFYARYVTYNNLNVDDESGVRLRWFDGIAAPFINGNTKQLYADGWIYQLDPLQPVGTLPSGFCLFHDEADSGLLYGSQGNQLTVLAERGTSPGGPENEPAGSLARQPINQIVPSPDFASDQTIFVVAGESALYRSTDGGVQWLHLRNGLLLDGVTTLTVAISPDFANDHTLFASGYRQESMGGGVFRSLDGGDRWESAWAGLSHLRIYSLLVSPAYASDQSVLAFAHYLHINPWEAGTSLQRTDDGGATWTLALTSTNTISTEQVAQLLPAAATPAVPVRTANYGRAIERTTDGGVTWQEVALDQPETGSVIAIVPVTGATSPAPTYVLGTYGLWRVSNNGATVEQWVDERLTNRTYSNTLTALAVTPPLSDGRHRLFVGTYAGEFWPLDPLAMQWRAVAGQPLSPQTRAVTPSVTVTTTQAITATRAATVATVATVAATATFTTVAALTTPSPARPTPEPLSAEPPAGLFRPANMYASVWTNNRELQNRLGWATSDKVTPVTAASETFEHGAMLWRGDEQQIYALYADGRLAVFADTFGEGEQESDPTLSAPANRLQPVRGFGKVWREHREVRDGLGWATAKEAALTAQIQPFERGFMVWINGVIYVVSQDPDGTYRWMVA